MAQPLSGLQEYLRGVAVEDASSLTPLKREALMLEMALGRNRDARADRSEGRLADYQQATLADRRTQNQVLADLQREQIAARRAALANRPKPQGAVVTTAEGIFERTPGGLVPLVHPGTGKPLTPKIGEKPVTEFQGKNALYGSRAMMADGALSPLEDALSDEALTALNAKLSVQSTPVIGGAAGTVGNFMMSPDQQRFEQAQRNFVNAVLRQESGAVISDAEFENARKQYFRQPGDSKEVIAQKRANRKAAIQGFKKISGPAWPGDEAVGAMGAPAGAPAAGGGYSDPDKERRYQEWKAKQK